MVTDDEFDKWSMSFEHSGSERIHSDTQYKQSRLSTGSDYPDDVLHQMFEKSGLCRLPRRIECSEENGRWSGISTDCYGGFNLWNWNGKFRSGMYKWGSPVVRSFNGRQCIGNGSEFHNTEFECDDELLCEL
jgi:hypothetical protein